MVTTTTVPVQQVSATAQASRNQPAYFAVDTKPGAVTISTSSGIDWVMEYIDEDNLLTVVNEKGTIGGESATFVGKGGTVYVKVYPFTFSDQGTVTLTAQNAESVTACTSLRRPLHHDPAPYHHPEEPCPGSSLPSWLSLSSSSPGGDNPILFYATTANL